MSWYFVEVEKQHEEDVLELMKSSPFEAFLPKKQRYFKKQELVTWVERLLFPGTIMIVSNFPQAEFTKQFNEWLSQHSDLSQLIHLEEKEYFFLQEDERLFLNSLMNEQRVIPISTGVLNEKQLIVESGPLQGVESRIKKIDRHQRTAQVQFQICGQMMLLYLGLIVKQSD